MVLATSQGLLVLQRQFYRAQRKKKEEEADRRRDEKTILKSGRGGLVTSTRTVEDRTMWTWIVGVEYNRKDWQIPLSLLLSVQTSQ